MGYVTLIFDWYRAFLGDFRYVNGDMSEMVFFFSDESAMKWFYVWLLFAIILALLMKLRGKPALDIDCFILASIISMCTIFISWTLPLLVIIVSDFDGFQHAAHMRSLYRY